jgi:hypothetical protein
VNYFKTRCLETIARRTHIGQLKSASQMKDSVESATMYCDEHAAQGRVL